MAAITETSSPSPKLDSTPAWWTRASGQIWRMIAGDERAVAALGVEATEIVVVGLVLVVPRTGA